MPSRKTLERAMFKYYSGIVREIGDEIIKTSSKERLEELRRLMDAIYELAIKNRIVYQNAKSFALEMHIKWNIEVKIVNVTVVPLHRHYRKEHLLIGSAITLWTRLGGKHNHTTFLLE